MDDRRQGDRRQNSIAKITIPLSHFIYICVIFVIIIVSTIIAIKCYNSGYSNGYSDGYYGIYDEDMTDVLEEEYTE